MSQAYAAGCNIVILASTFERVQIIPGAIHSYIKIYALDCSTDTGKIAAAYENKICIFEPTPISSVEKHHNHLLDYRFESINKRKEYVVFCYDLLILKSQMGSNWIFHKPLERGQRIMEFGRYKASYWRLRYTIMEGEIIRDIR